MRKLKAKLKSPDGEKLTAIFNTVDYIKLKDLLSHHYPKHELISWKIEKIEFIEEVEDLKID